MQWIALTVQAVLTAPQKRKGFRTLQYRDFSRLDPISLCLTVLKCALTLALDSL